MDRIKPSATFAVSPEQIERLRDEFAMSALTGLLASGRHGECAEYPFATIARVSYQHAEAMLKAREE